MAYFAELIGQLHLESLNVGYNQISSSMHKMLDTAVERCFHACVHTNKYILCTHTLTTLTTIILAHVHTCTNRKDTKSIYICTNMRTFVCICKRVSSCMFRNSGGRGEEKRKTERQSARARQIDRQDRQPDR